MPHRSADDSRATASARRVETAGKKRAVIIHTATGEHLRQLESLFQDVIEATAIVSDRLDRTFSHNGNIDDHEL